MKKDKFNSKFREYASRLSPQPSERDLISAIYKSLNDLFGAEKCVQVGSYPRFTAITPVNDLDVLYFLGDWNENNHDPSNALKIVERMLINDYKNPTTYEIEASLQTHSVSVAYMDNNNELFSVDIIPAYFFGRNEFNQDTYRVPEVMKIKNHKDRKNFYEQIQLEDRSIDWISSDPRGYITVASKIDKLTAGELRKTVKIIKAWKNNLVSEDKELRLKSFHLEQVITQYFQEDQELEIFDAIFEFFIELPDILNKPNQIKDRANNDKFIDDYLEKFSEKQKDKIKMARDGLLVGLENMDDTSTVEELLEIDFFKRPSSEKFLFDASIKTLLDDNKSLKIYGEVQERNGFRKCILNALGLIEIDREIKFKIKGDPPSADLFKWKVKNDNSCDQPRGEITDHRTLRDPEKTKFNGTHYVECYAIKDHTCVARARQYVILKRLYGS